MKENSESVLAKSQHINFSPEKTDQSHINESKENGEAALDQSNVNGLPNGEEVDFLSVDENEIEKAMESD